VRPEVRAWFDRSTTTAAAWPLAAVLERKGTERVSVVLPALDEEATVGAIVAAIRGELMDAVPLVDELVVMDSGSSDATAAVAAEAGARVVHRDAVLPGMGSLPGKGEVLWKSLAVTDGDLVVFVDADLTDFRAHFVPALLGPLLADPGVQLTKAIYDRPLSTESGISPSGGGRVTELVARPLLNLHWPELAGVVQPLSGEYAARRELLDSVPFASGYGVDVGLLLDAFERCGLDAIAQVDLGRRSHSHQSDAGLGRMASAIWQTVLDRLSRHGRLDLRDAPSPVLTQFQRVGALGSASGYRADSVDVAVTSRPPMREVADYAARRRAS
jgi:glucosyl-3-phosphoglycerate synthase